MSFICVQINIDFQYQKGFSLGLPLFIYTKFLQEFDIMGTSKWLNFSEPNWDRAFCETLVRVLLCLSPQSDVQLYIHLYY